MYTKMIKNRMVTKFTPGEWEKHGYIGLESGDTIEFVSVLSTADRDLWMVKTGKHAGKQVSIWRSAWEEEDGKEIENY